MSSPHDDQFLEKTSKESVPTIQSTATRHDEVHAKEEVTEPDHDLMGPITSTTTVPNSGEYHFPSEEMPKLPDSMERSLVEIEPESLDRNVSKTMINPALLPREDQFHHSSSSSRQHQEPYSALMRGGHESSRHDGPTYEHWQQLVNPSLESSPSFDTSSKHSAANNQNVSRQYYDSSPQTTQYTEQYYNNHPPPSHESYRSQYYSPAQSDQAHHQHHYQSPMNQPQPPPPPQQHHYYHHDYYHPHYHPHQNPLQYQYRYQNYEGAPSHHNIQSSQRAYPPIQSAQRESYIEHLSKHDVLCGRGGATNSHIGNRNFRALVKDYQDKYLRAKKKDKPTVASEVVEKIRTRGGRFLEKVKDVGLWRDIGKRKAMEKTSQALREGAPRIRKQMQKDRGEPIGSDGTSPEKSIGTEDEASQRETDVSKEVIDESNPMKKRKFSDDAKKISEVVLNTSERAQDLQTQPIHFSRKKDSRPDSEKDEDIGSSKMKRSKKENDPQPYSMPLTRMELSKVDEKDLTQDEKNVYASFDPPKNNPRKQETKISTSQDGIEPSVGERTSQTEAEESA